MTVGFLNGRDDLGRRVVIRVDKIIGFREKDPDNTYVLTAAGKFSFELPISEVIDKWRKEMGLQ